MEQSSIPSLDEFNPEEMRENYTAMIVAKRGSGKSTLIKDLVMETNVQFDQVIVFSDTAFNKFYDGWVDEIYQAFEPEVLEVLLLEQTLAPAEERPTILIIIDDTSKEDIYSSPVLSKLFTQGRHFGISVILSLQKLQMTNTTTRENVDYVFILSQYNKKTIDTIIEEYMDFSDAKFDRKYKYKLRSREILDHYTQDFNLLVRDTVARSHKVEDVLFSYRARIWDIEFEDEKK